MQDDLPSKIRKFIDDQGVCRYVVLIQNPDNDTWSYFAVGDNLWKLGAAKFLAEHFQRTVLEQPNLEEQQPGSSSDDV